MVYSHILSCTGGTPKCSVLGLHATNTTWTTEVKGYRTCGLRKKNKTGHFTVTIDPSSENVVYFSQECRQSGQRLELVKDTQRPVIPLERT